MPGLAGMGKTALAIHVAYLVKEHFDSGQLFIELHDAAGRPVGSRPGTGTVSPLVGTAARA